MEGYLAHTVGIGVDRYYTDLSQATWSTLMEDLPYSMSIPAVDEQQCANAPIWVMWWQGVDNQAPDIIQACVRSIRKHANGHPVHVISKQNLHEYASIDESVVQAAECGEIPMAVLSDIIRCILDTGASEESHEKLDFVFHRQHPRQSVIRLRGAFADAPRHSGERNPRVFHARCHVVGGLYTSC